MASYIVLSHLSDPFHIKLFQCSWHDSRDFLPVLQRYQVNSHLRAFALALLSTPWQFLYPCTVSCYLKQQPTPLYSLSLYYYSPQHLSINHTTYFIYLILYFLWSQLNCDLCKGKAYCLFHCYIYSTSKSTWHKPLINIKWMNKLGWGIKQPIRQACLLPGGYCKLLGEIIHI